MFFLLENKIMSGDIFLIKK